MVVNIDNGFGAGYAAATIARRIAGVSATAPAARQ
jgi:NCAIR mutase (PurE)-related protein